MGECGLLLNAKRALDIIAQKKTICYEISKDTLIKVLGSNFIDIILYSMFRVNIVKNAFFKDIIIDSLMIDLFKCFSLKKYSNREVVFHKTSNYNNDSEERKNSNI